MAQPRDPFNAPDSDRTPPAPQQKTKNSREVEVQQAPDPPDYARPVPRHERTSAEQPENGADHAPATEPSARFSSDLQIDRPIDREIDPETGDENDNGRGRDGKFESPQPRSSKSAKLDTASRAMGAGRDSLPGRIADKWNQFWFSPIESSFNFSIFRTGLGVIAFIWLATFIPDLTTFFGNSGLDPSPFYQTTRLGIFRLLTADIFLWIGLLLGLVASGLMIWGRYVKFAGPTLAVLVASFMGENRLLWNAGDEVLRTFTLFFAVFCLLTPSYVLDTPIGKAAKLNVSLPEGRNWLFRLVQIQMTIIYLVTFLAKIPGESWRNGTAAMTMFRLESMERFYVPGFLESNFFLGNLITWATLILEGTLPFLLWNRRARPYAVAAGVAFHLIIAWSISIGIFSWVMILGYVPFLSAGFLGNARRVFRRDTAAPGVNQLQKMANTTAE